jgi:hypothetical protein
VDGTTGEPLESPSGGDTLPLFIVCELAETFDEDAADADQLAEAARVMESARNNLTNVIAALGR